MPEPIPPEPEPDAEEANVVEEEMQQTVPVQRSIEDINALLSQAAVDMEDEADPALSVDNASELMESLTPEAIQTRLAEYLAENANDNGHLSDFISNMKAESFGPSGLNLTYISTSLSPVELDTLENKQALQMINASYSALGLSGTVTLSPAQGGSEKKRYRRGSYIENQHIAANPAVMHANKLLNTRLVDARLIEKDDDK